MKTVLLFVALMLSVSADAGWYHEKHCYPDTVTALAAFRSQFPFCCSGNPPAMTREYVATTVNSSGLMSIQIEYKSGNGAAWVQGTPFTHQLVSCDATLVNSGDEQFMMATLATVFLFVLGFRVGGNMSNPKGGFA